MEVVQKLKGFGGGVQAGSNTEKSARRGSGRDGEEEKTELLEVPAIFWGLEELNHLSYECFVVVVVLFLQSVVGFGG